MANKREPIEGKGTIFPNNKKASPSSPDWYGEFMYRGEVIPISGWHRSGTGQYGEWQLISLAVDTYKQNKEAYKNAPKDITPSRGRAIDESDIPF